MRFSVNCDDGFHDLADDWKEALWSVVEGIRFLNLFNVMLWCWLISKKMEDDCLRMSSCNWVTFYLEVGGRICTPATAKPFIPQNVRNAKINLKTHSVGVSPVQLPSTGQLTR